MGQWREFSEGPDGSMTMPFVHLRTKTVHGTWVGVNRSSNYWITASAKKWVSIGIPEEPDAPITILVYMCGPRRLHKTQDWANCSCRVTDGDIFIVHLTFLRKGGGWNVYMDKQSTDWKVSFTKQLKSNYFIHTHAHTHIYIYITHETEATVTNWFRYRDALYQQP